MTKRTLNDLQNAARGIRGMNAKFYMMLMKKGLQFYLDVLIIRHFAPGYGRNAGWRPNTREYQEWKRKNFGNLPQLVLSGKLAASSTRAKINKVGSKFQIRWSTTRARKIGSIQARNGRDWTIPSKRDKRDILRKMKKELNRLRKKEIGIYVSNR